MRRAASRAGLVGARRDRRGRALRGDRRRLAARPRPLARAAGARRDRRARQAARGRPDARTCAPARRPTCATAGRACGGRSPPALALMPVLRAAAWVVVPVRARRARRSPRWRRPAGGAGASSRAGLGAAVGAAAARAGAGHAGAARAARRVAPRPALRGAVLAGGLLLVFVPLLTSADAAFAEILQRRCRRASTMPVERALGSRVVRARSAARCCSSRVAPLRPRARRPAHARPRPSGRCRSARSWRCSARSSRCSSRRCSPATATCSTPPGSPTPSTRARGFAQLIVVAALTLAVVAAARPLGARRRHAAARAAGGAVPAHARRARLRAQAARPLRGGVRLHPAALRRARDPALARRAVRARPRRRGAAWLPRAALAVTAARRPRVRARRPRPPDRRAQRRPLRAHGQDRPRVPRTLSRRRSRARGPCAACRRAAGATGSPGSTSAARARSAYGAPLEVAADPAFYEDFWADAPADPEP